ncbi:hypothetical protein [Spiroplasma sp. SV19]|uniref:oxidoreductase n=1 Tax=Spiroplasma sp. SV19 TaxID=2570468 RepID=UPI0024B6F6A5|nr:hypothetical protein [Spiroplasma sp. SV19]
MRNISDKAELIPGLKSRNRIIMPPMDTLMAKDGIANEFHIQHYGARAYGGVGTIIVESTGISSEGRIRESDLGLWDDNQIEPLKKVVDLVHKAGAKIGIQLNHAGSKSILDQETIGATRFYDYLDQTNLRIATQEDLDILEEKFIAAAYRAQKAGFDFVELHSAFGYFMSELLHPILNDVIKSDDILVRGKMILNIARRLKEEVKMPFGIRISIGDGDGNVKTEDMCEPFIRELNKYVAYFNISTGETISKVRMADIIRDLGTKLFTLYYVNKVKQWTNKTIITAGNFQTREDIEIGLKAADFIAIGRELIFNPSLVISTILNTNEMNEIDYHWNDNLWFNPVTYKEMIERLKGNE